MRTGREGTVSCRAFVVRFNDENCFHYVMIEQQNMKGSRSMAGSASNIFVERLVESVIIDGHKVGSKERIEFLVSCLIITFLDRLHS